MLTTEQKKKYIEQPYSCPYCGSADITGTKRNSDYNQVWDTILCGECDKTWKDIYTLTDIEEVQ